MRYLVYILLCLSIGSNAQISSKVVLRKDTIKIGEVAKIQYEITALQDPTTLRFELSNFDTLQNQLLPLEDTQNDGDFEIINEGDWSLNKRIIDPSSMKWQRMNQAWILQNIVEVQCWMGGVYLIPPIEIIGVDSTIRITKLPAYLFVPVPEDNMLADTTAQQKPLPIRDIIKEDKTIEDFIPYIIAILLFLFIVAAIWWYRKRKHRQSDIGKTEAPVEIIPAHIIALSKLEKLDQLKLWQENKIKEYQTQLTYIIREYLENRYNIMALESTTDEIKRALKKQHFDINYEVKLVDILQMADLIKFAKAMPPADIHTRFMSDAVQFVNDTKEITEKLD